MFGGFKARLNLFGGKRTTDHFELAPDLCVTGAYRINREDFYGYTHDLPKSRPIEQPPPLRPVKSTSNLVQPKSAVPNLRNSTPSISRDPRGGEQSDRNSIPAPNKKDAKQHEKEQKKIEKERLAEQKKREKQAKEQAKEQAKQEKIRERAQKAKPKDKRDKRQAPTPAPAQSQQMSPPPAPAYPTNTLESSISRSSGPPPYSQVPTKPESSTKSNVTYSKPADTGSWDIISQHREQINRPAAVADVKRKQMVMDLNYNIGSTSDNKENSDA